MAAGIFRRRWFPRLKPRASLISINASPNLGGVESTTGFGTFLAQIDKSLSGVEATAQVGTTTFTTFVNLSGVESTTGFGTFFVQLDQNISLSGVEATAQIGSSSFTQDLTLTGQQATTDLTVPFIGFSTVNISLTGLASTAQVGSSSPTRSVRMQGLEVTAELNSDTFNIFKFVNLVGLEVRTSPNEDSTFTPAGGGGGGAAGLFGDGEDGGPALNFGIGGYGGFADNNNVPRQNTSGAMGNSGTEFNGLIGSGSGAGGGDYNLFGVGQNGGDGGNYGGGGGGGGCGRDGGGLGGVGAFGVCYISYTSSVTSNLVEIILDKDSTSPFVFPSDWSFFNTIILVGPGGCGEDAGLNGGDGGFGGDTVGVQNTALFEAGDFVDFHVSSVPCGEEPTTFHEAAAAGGANGGGTGGGGAGAGAGFAGGFRRRGGRGGPRGVLSTFGASPGIQLPTPPPVFAQAGSLTTNLPGDRTFFIAGIPQIVIPAGIVLLPTSENLSIVTAVGNSYVVGSSQFYTIGELRWNGASKVQGIDWQLVAPFKHIAQIINTAGIVTPITAVYYRWDVGIRAGFKVNSYPVKFGFSGTTIIAEQVPPINDFFTVEYTVDRRGDNPRSMFAILPTLIDDMLPLHDLYDGNSGFQSYRPSGYKVYDQNDNQVWQWSGTAWINTGQLAPDTEFYVKSLRQIMIWDGAVVTMLYSAGDGSSAVDEVLEGPARPYPPYGESIGKNFLQDAFSVNAAVDFPAAYEISLRIGDYDPWVPGI